MQHTINKSILGTFETYTNIINR